MTRRAADRAVLPVLSEELAVDKRAVERSRARVTKNVRQREQVVEEPLLRDHVDIKRVVINRVIERPPKFEVCNAEASAVRSVHRQRIVLRGEEVNVARIRARSAKAHRS
jgi:stress response protein YsnF